MKRISPRPCSSPPGSSWFSQRSRSSRASPPGSAASASSWSIGLPGNPTSALVTARLLLAPLIAGMVGQPIETALRWRSAHACNGRCLACGERETFHRARMGDGESRSFHSRIRALRRRLPKPICWCGRGRIRRAIRAGDDGSRCSTALGEQQLGAGDRQDQAERAQQPRPRQPLDPEPRADQRAGRRPRRERSAARQADGRPTRHCLQARRRS